MSDVEVIASVRSGWGTLTLWRSKVGRPSTGNYMWATSLQATALLLFTHFRIDPTLPAVPIMAVTMIIVVAALAVSKSGKDIARRS